MASDAGSRIDFQNAAVMTHGHRRPSAPAFTLKEAAIEYYPAADLDWLFVMELVDPDQQIS